MKKILFLSLFSLFAFFFAAPAADRAADIVARLSADFRAMDSYRVGFEVTMGEYRMAGNYSVAGENYCLALGDAQVYADGRTRYEVDNRRKEVTLGRVDPADRSILNNPAHAFDFLDSEYRPSLLWERDGEAAVLLKPVAGSGAATGSVTLVVATQTMRPTSVEYEFDGERITVRILSVEPMRGALPAFDKAAYATYEWIDFR